MMKQITKSKKPWYKRRKTVAAIVTLALALIASHLVPPAATVLIPLEIGAIHQLISGTGDSDESTAGHVLKEPTSDRPANDRESESLPGTGELQLQEMPSGI